MITLSPPEIIALLIESDKAASKTDALNSAHQKLCAEYKRIIGRDPLISSFEVRDNEYPGNIEGLNPHQQMLIEGYYALDPETKFLGYFKDLPVFYAYTAPARLRGNQAFRNVTAVSRHGSPVTLPKNTWMDNFIPAHGVSWAEASQIIEEWQARREQRTATEA